jgi:hypothetical protein
MHILYSQWAGGPEKTVRAYLCAKSEPNHDCEAGSTNLLG